mmetsp:Transcript_76041/g.163218  ORF Transcript_76041/g.163218 Transcript_76041/m.163218 type:complete len:158 (+) Transcript_76041:67-540(+)
MPPPGDFDTAEGEPDAWSWFIEELKRVASDVEAEVESMESIANNLHDDLNGVEAENAALRQANLRLAFFLAQDERTQASIMEAAADGTATSDASEVENRRPSRFTPPEPGDLPYPKFHRQMTQVQATGSDPFPQRFHARLEPSFNSAFFMSDEEKEA